jgi:ribonuclease P protein component
VDVQRRGRKHQSEHFFLLLVVARAAPGASRVGITVSTKVGNAVTRNRLKRWVREHLRRHRSELPGGETVVVAKASAAGVDHTMIDRDLRRLFHKARETR